MAFEKSSLKWKLGLVFIQAKLGYVLNRFEDITMFSFLC